MRQALPVVVLATAVARAEADGRESAFEGEGLLAWDEKQKQTSSWTWADNGSISTGTVVLEGPLVRFLQPRERGSTRPATRSTWIRLDADSYRAAREQKDGVAWKELFSVVYRRAPASPRR